MNTKFRCQITIRSSLKMSKERTGAWFGFTRFYQSVQANFLEMVHIIWKLKGVFLLVMQERN